MKRTHLASLALLVAFVVAPHQVWCKSGEGRPPPKISGLEIGLRGGWMFQLNQPVTDNVTDRGRIKPGGSGGVDIEAGAMLGDHLSVLLRFGYKSRIEELESPLPDEEHNLKLVYSLVHLPSINLKLRPWYKRVCLYVTVGGGLDLVVYEPTVGPLPLPRMRQPGAGINAGIGLEVFVSKRFGLAVDLRDHLSFHGTGFITRADDVSGEPTYDLEFGPVHHTLCLFVGLEFRP